MKKIPKKLKKHGSYEIQWRDITDDQAWTDFSRLDTELAIITQIGFFIKEYDDVLVFCSQISSLHQYASISRIPRGTIQSIKEIR